MLRIGNVNPLSIMNGWKKRNVDMLACCWVFETVEMNRPAPSVVRIKKNAARHSVPKFPANGTWKISRATPDNQQHIQEADQHERQRLAQNQLHWPYGASPSIAPWCRFLFRAR